MRPIPLLLLALTLVTPALSAGADDGLRRCRSVTDPAARLACYDALPVEAPPARSGASTPVPATVPAARPAASAATSSSPATAPAAPASRSGQPVLQGGLVESFGMEGRTVAAELPEIDSHIPGTFLGWSQHSQIRLANGQVWQVVDEGSRRMQLKDPKVRVRRGLMGAFYLEFEAHNHSPRVRRVE